jgi:hypothetical protein
MSTTFARYPKPRLRPFLLEVFEAWGCRVAPGSGVLDVELTRSLQKRFGARRVRLRLTRGGRPQENGGELMVPGNPVYRAVLDLARQKGGVGRGYVPAPQRRPAASTMSKAVRKAVKIENASYRALVREELYHPVLLFHFNLCYGAPEIPDEIRTVAWDVVAGAETDASPFVPGGLSLLPEPEDGLNAGRTDGIEAVFQKVEAALRTQIAKKVSRTEARARKQLDKESARIESFYRRMIEEEKSRPRARSDGEAGLSRKIELYQLDWKRKLSEATERHRPRIDVRLFGIEEVYVPRRRAALVIAGVGAPERESYYDYMSKGIVGPACDACGRRSLKASVCKGGHLCCDECVRTCGECGEIYCQQCWTDAAGGRGKRGAPEVDPSVMMKMDPGCAGAVSNRKRGSSK